MLANLIVDIYISSVDDVAFPVFAVIFHTHKVIHFVPVICSSWATWAWIQWMERSWKPPVKMGAETYKEVFNTRIYFKGVKLEIKAILKSQENHDTLLCLLWYSGSHLALKTPNLIGCAFLRHWKIIKKIGFGSYCSVCF